MTELESNNVLETLKIAQNKIEEAISAISLVQQKSEYLDESISYNKSMDLCGLLHMLMNASGNYRLSSPSDVESLEDLINGVGDSWVNSKIVHEREVDPNWMIKK